MVGEKSANINGSWSMILKCEKAPKIQQIFKIICTFALLSTHTSIKIENTNANISANTNCVAETQYFYLILCVYAIFFACLFVVLLWRHLFFARALFLFVSLAMFRWNFSNLWRLQLVNHSMVVRFTGKLKQIGSKRVFFFNFAKILVRDRNTSAKQEQFTKTMEYTESET